MTLFTPEIRERLINNGLSRQDSHGQEFDPFPVVKLVDDLGGVWLFTELYPDDPDLAFGLVDLGFGTPERGDVRLSQLLAGGVDVRVDPTFKARAPLSEYAELAWRTGSVDREPEPIIPPAQREKLLENGRAHVAALANGEPEIDFHPVVKFKFTRGIFLLTLIFPDEPNIAYGLESSDHYGTSIGKIRLAEIERAVLDEGIHRRDDEFSPTMPLTGYALALLKRRGGLDIDSYGRRGRPRPPRYDDLDSDIPY